MYLVAIFKHLARLTVAHLKFWLDGITAVALDLVFPRSSFDVVVQLLAEVLELLDGKGEHLDS